MILAFVIIMLKCLKIRLLAMNQNDFTINLEKKKENEKLIMIFEIYDKEK
jgi:hypothetical protein